MINQTASIHPIQSAITDEIFYALGLKRRGLMRRILGWWFARPAIRFSQYMAEADSQAIEGGVPAACQKLIDKFEINLQSQGAENIPHKGPAVLLANHPGAYDSIAIGSLVPRKDLKIVVGKTRFYQKLPHIYPNLIIASAEKFQNMLALRHIIAHLQAGGILLMFGSGSIEPDPAIRPVGDEVFARWYKSSELLLRKVPQTVIVPTIASGVLLDRFASHAITKLRRRGIDKRRLAEFMQVIQHILKPGSVDVHPSVSFGRPFSARDLESQTADRRLMPAILDRVRQQLSDHLDWIKPLS